MKYFYLSILFFISFNSYSQQELLGEWFLNSINYNGVQFDNYFTRDSDVSLFLTFNEIVQEEEQLFINFDGHSSCNPFTGNYLINGTSLIPHDGTVLLGGCNGIPQYRYENNLLSIFGYIENGTDNTLGYTISGTGINSVLTLTKSNGDFVVYSKIPPSTTIFRNWFLQSIEANGTVISIPNDNSPTLNLTTQSDALSRVFLDGFGDCNSFTGFYNIYANDVTAFSINTFTTSSSDCTGSSYESLYFDILSNMSTNQLSFEIIDNGRTLILTDVSGRKLYFGDQLINTELLREWFLQSMNIDGIQDTNIPDDASIIFTTDPGDNNGLALSGLGACEGFYGAYIITSDSTLDIVAFNQTLSGCATAEEVVFENNYFHEILSTGNTTNFQYAITGIGPDTTLTLTNTLNGNVAIYGPSAPNPIVGEWFLYELLNLDVPVYNTSFPNMNIIFSEDMGNLTIQGTSTCNTFSGTTTSVEPTYFEALPPNWTELDCSGDENFDSDAYYLEQVFMQLFNFNFDDVNSTPTRFYYNKTGFGDDAILEIYNFNSETNDGYYARFERQTLSVSENEINKLSISIKTNPVEYELHLNMNESSGDQFNYQIFTIDGKQIREKAILESETINVENLSSGMYFLLMSSEANLSQTLKFIKK